jgi:hypothetical protein
MSKKKKFSSFSLAEAFKQLEIIDLLPWLPTIDPIEPSSFFQQRLERLQCFDLQSYEESKKLLIDAICEEAIQEFQRLKIWKGAVLESDCLTGYADYLVAERKRYLEAPIICIIEAKKDDFEQGLAQCLVEMQACQWINQQINVQAKIYGIVTNGDTWKFYKLDLTGDVYETLPYSISDMPDILGLLRYVFQQCEEVLKGDKLCYAN